MGYGTIIHKKQPIYSLPHQKGYVYDPFLLNELPQDIFGVEAESYSGSLQPVLQVSVELIRKCTLRILVVTNGFTCHSIVQGTNLFVHADCTVKSCSLIQLGA